LKKIKVEPSSGSYNVVIGDGVFSKFHSLVQDAAKKKILVIADENVLNLHKKKIKNILSSAGSSANFYVLKPGEKSKSYQELNKIYSFLIEKNYGRDSMVVVIGGGVTGDLGAFAASTYMRGIRLVNIPTTILAAVDSAVGGKTGINFNNRKNMIGSFYQPEAVIIDTTFITTLPVKEVTSGIGEIIKYAFLGDEKLFSFIDKNIPAIYQFDSKVIEDMIYKSLLIKTSVVTQDEKENGIRKILNLGHTFAHAYESDLQFKVTHGEAVTAGVISALLLSNRKGLLSDSLLESLIKMPLKVKLSKKINDFNINNVYKTMFSDKKNRDGKIKFVLVAGIGKILVDMDAEKDDVIYALKRTKEFIS
jgi:3-dehydroquinate synthase